MTSSPERHPPAPGGTGPAPPGTASPGRPQASRRHALPGARSLARRLLAAPAAWAGLALLLAASLMPCTAPLFRLLFPGVSPPVYGYDSFLSLLASHAGLVLLSSLASAAAGVALAVLVTRPEGREFRPLVDAAGAIGQTFPPAAVLALAVPAMGYGAGPTAIALALYGLFPVLRNAIAGLEGVPPAVREAAEGLGFGRWRRLLQVELPLAAPTIMAGVRVSVIVNIGTATIGSTVGALTLGTPIIGGLVSEKLGYVVQGTIVVGLFAIFTDLLLESAERAMRPPG